MIWRIKMILLAAAMVMPSVHGHGDHQPHTHEEVEVSLPEKRKK
jgi:hypothetical protein